MWFMFPAGMDGQQQAFLKHLGNVFLWTLSLEESLVICVSFVSPNNVPLSSFHLLWSCFFLHSLPILGLQRRFPKCKGKKLKSLFVLSSILSLSNVSEYFQFFLYFTCTSFSLQLWWTRWSHITENVLCGKNKVEVIKT